MRICFVRVGVFGTFTKIAVAPAPSRIQFRGVVSGHAGGGKKKQIQGLGVLVPPPVQSGAKISVHLENRCRNFSDSRQGASPSHPINLNLQSSHHTSPPHHLCHACQWQKKAAQGWPARSSQASQDPGKWRPQASRQCRCPLMENRRCARNV